MISCPCLFLAGWLKPALIWVAGLLVGIGLGMCVQAFREQTRPPRYHR